MKNNAPFIPIVLAIFLSVASMGTLISQNAVTKQSPPPQKWEDFQTVGTSMTATGDTRVYHGWVNGHEILVGTNNSSVFLLELK